MIKKKPHVEEILDQVEGFSYEDLDDLVYHIQGIQLDINK